MIHFYWPLTLKELGHFIHTQILKTNPVLMIFSLLSGRISTLRDETGAVSITMLMYISKLDHIML